ncbi:MAG: PHP domain-containing protein [Lachnospiraceae bacterium]|nr:PHP domain-containing protein [Lachnospiraceae bacterium]
MKRIDLHVHSTCSDGTFSPASLAEYAARKGLQAFALTDHDTLEGIPEAAKAADACGIELIPGIEFSTAYQEQDLHILGLDLDCSNPVLLEEIGQLQEERKRRNQKMIDKMAADGINISKEQMIAAFGDTLWTRAHFARYLEQTGYVTHMWDAFQTYIGDHCPYYIPREKTSPFHIVRLIRDTGGIPVLAHPFQYHLDEEGLTVLIKALKQSGLLGIEAIYSTHTKAQENEIRKLARNFGLCISGGSDFHGANKPDIDLGTGKGNLEIPYELLERLRAARFDS